MKTINIFIFRRDLRIIDNVAYNSLIKQEPDIPIMHIFIFNPDQIESSRNKYFNHNSVKFMIQSLHELNMTLHNSLHYFYGKDIEILTQLMNRYKINTISFNLDYTPFAINRDANIINWCVDRNISYLVDEDYTLLPLRLLKPFKTYSSFYRIITKKIAKNVIVIDSDQSYRKKNIFKDFSKTIKNIDQFYKTDTTNEVLGGRKDALDILYKNPNLDLLRVYIKFGCISIREVFIILRNKYGLINEHIRDLLWIEFYSHSIFNNPDILERKIEWHNNRSVIDAFTSGKTGIPIIDAIIRNINSSGSCINKNLIYIYSFCANILKISPQYIELWFSSKILGYDPTYNIGLIYSCYSLGFYSPLYKWISPHIYSQQIDNNTKYIKLWVPELKNIPTNDIHNWSKKYTKYNLNYTNYINVSRNSLTILGS